MQDIPSDFTVILAVLCALVNQRTIVTSACHVIIAINAGLLKPSKCYNCIPENALTGAEVTQLLMHGFSGLS